MVYSFIHDTVPPDEKHAITNRMLLDDYNETTGTIFSLNS